MSIRDIVISNVLCTICGSKGVGTCNCWATCYCGWRYRNIKGEKCGNPEHYQMGDESDAALDEERKEKS